ncbi:MAG: ribonuclease H-like domain-containing protein [Candidatus Pacebacteria bacterium]|nr:ribonuclease H-like domain-containing protein [Candidatus Paceibacterota bacterium]MCF7857543.1 ribonuclease H-like domain-containing protein [Candidatus Paceibacterota bacterium]
MRTLIFDIETIGEDWNGFDEATKDSLTHWIDRVARSDEEKEVLLDDLKNCLGLSPLTGTIVAIGVYDLELHQGVVYYSGGEEADFEIEDFVFKTRTEKEMLEDFWEGAKSYDTFVTFNGRRFDAPFLSIRSTKYDIRPSQNLMEGRYLYQQKAVRHIDLQEQMTFYGATQKRPPLHLFCRAFGIKSSKEEGISGEHIAELFRMKKFRDIAEYNARDVTATTKLYKKWLKNLAPDSFIEKFK